MADIDRILVTGGPGERRLALLAGDEIVEFVIDRFTPQTGDILLGRVLPRPKGLSATFVEIGDAQPGFLGQTSKAAEGEAILVQVSAAARRHKGAALSARPTLPGRWLALDPRRVGVTLSRRIAEPAARQRLTALLTGLLNPGEGVVARSSAPLASEAELAAELEALRRCWKAIERQAAEGRPPARLYAPDALERCLRDWPAVIRVETDQPWLLAEARRFSPAAVLVPRGWEESRAADLLEDCLERRVALPGGGFLVIDETEALTVIDIDSGGRPPMEANRAALAEIARHLRLRGLAGHIVIDVIPPVGKAEMAAWLDELAALLADDPTPTQMVGATRTGLVELTRERRRPSLSELFLCETAPRRDPRGLALDALRAALDAADCQLAAEPAVIQYLQSRPDLLAEFQSRMGRPLALRAEAGMTGYTLSGLSS